MGWGGTWEGGSGWGTHVNPWLIHVNVWQKPLQYCKVISLQLIKINGKKKKNLKSKKKEKKTKCHPVFKVLQCYLDLSWLYATQWPVSDLDSGPFHAQYPSTWYAV